MVKTPKFQLDRKDIGHNENEWGKIKKYKKSRSY